MLVDKLKEGIYDIQDIPCKVIFLDMDAVANSERSLLERFFNKVDFVKVGKIPSKELVSLSIHFNKINFFCLDEVYALVHLNRVKEFKIKATDLKNQILTLYRRLDSDKIWEQEYVDMINEGKEVPNNEFSHDLEHQPV